MSEYAGILLKHEAVMLRPHEPYTFASGIRSPIYCDNRVLLSYPVSRKKVAQGLVKLAKSFSPKQIAGVATAGIAWGAYVAESLNLPMSYVRTAAKEHGKKNRIEGRLEFDRSTLLVEDLVSTAGSLVSALDAVKEVGGKIAGAVSIFSYGFKEAEDSFTSRNCKYRPLITLDELLEDAKRANKISDADCEAVLRWRSDPKHSFT